MSVIADRTDGDGVNVIADSGHGDVVGVSTRFVGDVCRLIGPDTEIREVPAAVDATRPT
ncbi:hypothetical protein D3C84_1235380 [compost metagenome]